MSHLLIKDRKYRRHLVEPNEEDAIQMCKVFSKALETHFPGYLWTVGLNQDVVSVTCGTLDSEMGLKATLEQLFTDPKKLMRMGGEILERYGVNRLRYNPAEVRSLQRDYRGHIIPRN